MNIKEVRVGNYLLGNQYSYEKDYKVFQVESIHENGLNVWDGQEMGILADYEWTNVKPIPLDVEWLKKFGFVVCDGEDYMDIDHYEGFTELYHYDYFEIGVKDGAFHKIHIGVAGDESICVWEDSAAFMYVHQLQNLYFALTGNELSAE